MEPSQSSELAHSITTMINARASIDFALDLERQLEELHDDEVLKEMDEPAAAALDPDVLTSIIIQLRQNLEAVTTERDELIEALGQTQISNGNLEARVTDLTEQLDLETKRADAAEAKLISTQAKVQEDEEQINMLRTKVEESRKGIMRLQAESRRMSGNFGSGPQPLALDLSATRNTFPAPLASAKRATFGPNIPVSNIKRSSSMHRRISSLSEPGLSLHIVDPTDPGVATPSPSPRRTEFIDSFDAAKRASAVTRRDESLLSASPPRSSLHPSTAELEALRAELASVKRSLRESNDAREASETCLKVLREFMAHQHAQMESGDGPDPSLKGLRLPPLPTDTIADEEEVKPKPEPEVKKSGWGIRLWKENTNAAAQQSPQPAAATLTRTSSASSVPEQNPVPARSDATEASSLTSFVSSWTKSTSNASEKDAASIRSDTSSPSTQAQAQAQAAAPGLGGALRKFSLFSKAAPPPIAAAQRAAASGVTSPSNTTDSRGDVLSIGSGNTSSESSGPASPTDETLVALPLNLDAEHGNKTPTFTHHEPAVAV
ncbi:hypothetical protein BOTBODRAFT_28634 [Botryobasidium botryosum FD-172 SS1]|uniref:Uncharacterized protein n=1 Tax=Botryobasidium botryosum (strain FD-172 SS1) TaxID=930990 RepID=A0A067N4T2_BOTB1|nr:hypothetical protein BOTBODRAFT_28634 [Botryobasidium botryosum FD-172 SS1]